MHTQSADFAATNENAKMEAFLASQPQNNFWTHLYREHRITNVEDAIALAKKFRAENATTK